MKKNKLFLTTISSLTCIPISFVSCGQQTSQAQEIVNAIFNPTSLPEQKIVNSFADNLKTLTSEELNNELIYDLFDFANVNTQYTNDTLATLYKNEIVSIKTNIGKCNLSFDKNNKLLATFLGYVSFVFTKEYYNTVGSYHYYPDDYIMLTYEIDDLDVTPNNEQIGLVYSSNEEKQECLGFIKKRQSNTPDKLYYISEIDMNNKKDHWNSKNWVL